MDRISNAQMNSQGTRKIYYENVHQTDFTAVVTECVPAKEEGYYRIVLDASAFFPEEGGQSADKGTLKYLSVFSDGLLEQMGSNNVGVSSAASFSRTVSSGP